MGMTNVDVRANGAFSKFVGGPVRIGLEDGECENAYPAADLSPPLSLPLSLSLTHTHIHIHIPIPIPIPIPTYIHIR